MTTTIEDLRSRVRTLKIKQDFHLKEHARLSMNIQKVQGDLQNSLEEFVATSGRHSDEYHPWRRRATVAMLHMMEDLQKTAEEAEQARTELLNAQMELYAQESGYDGEDELGLLRALYYLVMGHVAEKNISLDDKQVGLITSIRLKLDIK